jgi:hypothetical protein
MRKLIVTIIIGNFLNVIFIQAQNNNELSIDDLKIPASPAFILLDVAPTSIDRPTTTNAFSTSVLNSINENNGLPENYAIDFAPYWFFKHQKLTAKSYWGYKKEKTNIKQTPFSQARFGNISLATVKSEIKTDTLGTVQENNNIAVGIRTTLVQTRSRKVLNEIDNWNAKHIARTSELMTDTNLSPTDLIKILEKDSVLNLCNENIAKLIKRRPVLALDFAGASSWSFDNNDYYSMKRNRAGVWLTLNYAQSLNKSENKSRNEFFNLYLTTRLLNTEDVLSDNGELISTTIFDNGGKLELELNKFSLSYEFIYRNNIKDELDDSFRSSGMIKYRATEQLLITATFGKNFGDFNNLITQIGLSWGIGNNNQGFKEYKAE